MQIEIIFAYSHIFTFTSHLEYVKINHSLEEAVCLDTKMIEFFIKLIKVKIIMRILDSKEMPQFVKTSK